jgi:hypothetical protein
MNQWQGLNVIVEMNMRIYKFERDKYGMNGCENLMICHFETGCLEGYTCAPTLDPQTFSLYRTNHAAQRIT